MPFQYDQNSKRIRKGSVKEKKCTIKKRVTRKLRSNSLSHEEIPGISRTCQTDEDHEIKHTDNIKIEEILNKTNNNPPRKEKCETIIEPTTCVQTYNQERETTSCRYQDTYTELPTNLFHTEMVTDQTQSFEDEIIPQNEDVMKINHDFLYSSTKNISKYGSSDILTVSGCASFENGPGDDFKKQLFNFEQTEHHDVCYIESSNKETFCNIQYMQEDGQSHTPSPQVYAAGNLTEVDPVESVITYEVHHNDVSYIEPSNREAVYIQDVQEDDQSHISSPQVYATNNLTDVYPGDTVITNEVLHNDVDTFITNSDISQNPVTSLNIHQPQTEISVIPVNKSTLQVDGSAVNNLVTSLNIHQPHTEISDMLVNKSTLQVDGSAVHNLVTSLNIHQPQSEILDMIINKSTLHVNGSTVHKPADVTNFYQEKCKEDHLNNTLDRSEINTSVVPPSSISLKRSFHNERSHTEAKKFKPTFTSNILDQHFHSQHSEHDSKWQMYKYNESSIVDQDICDNVMEVDEGVIRIRKVTEEILLNRADFAESICCTSYGLNDKDDVIQRFEVVKDQIDEKSIMTEDKDDVVQRVEVVKDQIDEKSIMTEDKDNVIQRGEVVKDKIDEKSSLIEEKDDVIQRLEVVKDQIDEKSSLIEDKIDEKSILTEDKDDVIQRVEVVKDDECAADKRHCSLLKNSKDNVPQLFLHLVPVQVVKELNLTEDKINEKSSLIEDKTKEMSKFTEDKIDEKSSLIKDKTEEMSKFPDDKIDEKSSLIKDKTEEMSKFTEDKIDEKSSLIKDKTEEMSKFPDDKIDEKSSLFKDKTEEMSKFTEDKINEKSSLIKDKTEEMSKFTEDKINEKSSLIEDKTEEMSSFTKDKINEKSSLIEDKTKEMSKFTEDKINEKSSLIEDKTEEMSKFTEDKIDEKSSLIEDKTKEMSKFTEDKINEKSSLIEDKTKEMSKFTEDKIDEKSSLIKDKTEEMSKFNDDKINEKSSCTGNKIDEKSSLFKGKIDETSSWFKDKIDKTSSWFKNNIHEKSNLIDDKINEKSNLINSKIDEQPSLNNGKIDEKSSLTKDMLNKEPNLSKDEISKPKIPNDNMSEHETRNEGMNYQDSEEVCNEISQELTRPSHFHIVTDIEQDNLEKDMQVSSNIEPSDNLLQTLRSIYTCRAQKRKHSPDFHKNYKEQIQENDLTNAMTQEFTKKKISCSWKASERAVLENSTKQNNSLESYFTQEFITNKTENNYLCRENIQSVDIIPSFMKSSQTEEDDDISCKEYRNQVSINNFEKCVDILSVLSNSGFKDMKEDKCNERLCLKQMDDVEIGINKMNEDNGDNDRINENINEISTNTETIRRSEGISTSTFRNENIDSGQYSRGRIEATLNQDTDVVTSFQDEFLVTKHQDYISKPALLLDEDVTKHQNYISKPALSLDEDVIKHQDYINKPDLSLDEDVQGTSTAQPRHSSADFRGTSIEQPRHSSTNFQGTSTVQPSKPMTDIYDTSKIPQNYFVSDSITELSDSQICQLSTEDFDYPFNYTLTEDIEKLELFNSTNFQHNFESTQNKTVQDIEKRKIEGKKLVDVIMSNLVALNRQLLNMKREMETVRRVVEQHHNMKGISNKSHSVSGFGHHS